MTEVLGKLSSAPSPASLIDTLITARAVGDIDRACACYEADALVVLRPGQAARGRDAVAAFVRATAGADLAFTGRLLLEQSDIALHQASWSLRLEDGSTARGRTADVLRRQEDGTWRLAIDNAWGLASDQE